MPLAALLRMFVLGAVAVVASSYALYRYYFVPRPPMIVPVAAPPATELPAPDLEPLKDHP